jgi:hypothetical protein
MVALATKTDPALAQIGIHIVATLTMEKLLQ